MSDLARATGAPGSIVICGKTYFISPLTLKDWGQIERECLETYRREYIQTYAKNLDLFPEAQRQPLLREALETAAKFGLGDLPKKETQVPVMKGGKMVFSEDGSPAMRSQLLPYYGWWCSESMEGKLFTTWLSVKKNHPDMALENWDTLISQAIEADSEKLDEVATLVDRVSTPGN